MLHFSMDLEPMSIVQHDLFTGTRTFLSFASKKLEHAVGVKQLKFSNCFSCYLSICFSRCYLCSGKSRQTVRATAVGPLSQPEHHEACSKLIAGWSQLRSTRN